ncbi:M48 family metallopeptidase [Saccharicrinis sp. FJH2]|uniref:M48 family metallopeptidase n=1 Tax=Saccharicrinis sp. FJH65 TaxID=3344659 RepID=UPI0035F3DC04
MKQISIILSVLFLTACATVPLTGRKQFKAVPSSQMLSLSASSYEQVLQENAISDNKKYGDMVKTVGHNISAAVEKFFTENNMQDEINNYKWEYNVLVSDELNAWCMPGGKIAFYEGIMPVCENETGVAVVMAHEVAHAIAEHGNERLSQQLALQLGGMALSEALEKEKETTQNLAMLAFGVGSQVGMMLPYSRLHEKEADEMGLYLMAMAGYDPRESITFWQRMMANSATTTPEFLSTHPSPDNRIKYLESKMDKAMEYYNASKAS